MICAWDWCALNPEGSVGNFNQYWADLSQEEWDVSGIFIVTDQSLQVRI